MGFMGLMGKLGKPALVGFSVGSLVFEVRLNNLQLLQRGEGFVMIGIDACSDACSSCCANAAIGIAKLDGGTRHACQCVAEDGAEEHICLASTNRLEAHAHLLHYFHAVGKAEDDAFLNGAKEMCLCVGVKVDAVNAGTYFLVAKHALCSVAEGKDAEAFSTNGSLCREVIHLGIAYARWGNITACP